jgi:hypothetical protein
MVYTPKPANDLFIMPTGYTNFNIINDGIEKMYSQTKGEPVKIIDPLRQLLKDDPSSIYYYIDR